jgi:MscS family membrane protein
VTPFDDLSLAGGSVLWGIAPWRVAAALAIVFAGFASRRAIRALFVYLGRRAGQTRILWDDEAARLLPRPLALVVQVLLWRVAAAALLLPTGPVNTRVLMAQGLDVALTVGLVWTFFRAVDVLALAGARVAGRTETRIDDQAVPLLRKTLKVVLAVLSVVFVIQNLGYSVTSILAGIGIGGLALALAAQDSVANLFGSVVLFTDSPFQLGDEVEVDGLVGTVEEVGFRTTRVRTDDGSLVSVPNQTFTSSFITNYSARSARLVEFTFALAPAPTAALEAFLARSREAFAAHPDVEPATVEVHLTGVGDGQIEGRAAASSSATSWSAFLATREGLLLRLLHSVEEAGLTLGTSLRAPGGGLP